MFDDIPGSTSQSNLQHQKKKGGVTRKGTKTRAGRRNSLRGITWLAVFAAKYAKGAAVPLGGVSP